MTPEQPAQHEHEHEHQHQHQHEQGQRPGADRPGARFLELARARPAVLEELMVRGETPSPGRLAGWEFRGANTPAWARLLGIKKFIKGIYRASSGQFFGYNRAVVQNRLDEPWLASTGGAGQATRPFGFYQVTPVDAAARDNAYLHAVLLDYGAGHNPSLDPSRVLRDYLVEVPGSQGELYLGKAYLALGPARLATSFFVLERMTAAPATARFASPPAPRS